MLSVRAAAGGPRHCLQAHSTAAFPLLARSEVLPPRCWHHWQQSPVSIEGRPPAVARTTSVWVEEPLQTVHRAGRMQHENVGTYLVYGGLAPYVTFELDHPLWDLQCAPRFVEESQDSSIRSTSGY